DDDDVVEDVVEEHAPAREANVEEVGGDAPAQPAQARDDERRGRRRRRRGGRDRHRDERPAQAQTPPGFGPQPVIDYGNGSTPAFEAQPIEAGDGDDGDDEGPEIGNESGGQPRAD